MGEAMLSAAAERLMGLIEEQARYHVNLVTGAEDEVRSLAEELKTIRYVLDDAENRRFKDNNINYWLSKLDGISYDMEDILDQWNCAILKLEMDQPSAAAPKRKVWSFIPSPCCLCLKKVVVRHEIATKILNVKAQLDKILKEKDRYSFVISKPTDHPLPKSWRDPSISFTVVEEVYGRDSVRNTLVTKLMGNGGSIMQVVSIVGVGGLGKTTLAQLVYNHSEIDKHFDLRIWVCVSDPFDLATIAKRIFEGVNSGNSPSTDNLETLWQCIREKISGKKILLVLDDVWTEEYGKWEPLEKNLRFGGEGSKILVTTRKRNVAKITGTMDEDILYPEMLSDEDCWQLMGRIACLGRDKVKFEDIGKKIAKKCNGLPLAARTLGSLLRSKSTLEQWEVVLNSDIWEMKEAELELFPHLLLSYNELSPALKRCFSYCAVFPKDTKLYVEKLIGYWVALGYLGSDTSSGDMEDRGREYFDILSMHSLLQNFEKDSVGNVISCQMHDIVHDFAQFLRKKGRVDESRTKTCALCRPSDLSQISTVNEYLSFSGDYRESPLCDCLTHLRVLSLGGCKLERLPLIMENFIHLRWLNLEGNHLSQESLIIIFQLFNLKILGLCFCKLVEIPAEIGNLIHLRCLDLSNNSDLKELPKEIWNLINLRQLYLSTTFVLQKKLPCEIANLTQLKFLNLSENGLEELPREIGNLTQLKFLNLSENGLEELPREIGNLTQLKFLNLSVNGLEELPREIGNLTRLKFLNLSWNRLERLPREIGNLTQLRHLGLDSNKSLKELPEEIGNLSELRHLDLSCNLSLEKLPESMRGLQELQSLDVILCKSLRDIPEGLAVLASLSSLTEFKGGSAWSKLELLKNLTHVGDRLVLFIKLGGDDDLGKVVKDCQEVELRNRKQITILYIRFEDVMDEKEPSCSSSRVRMDVIDALQPHPHLEELLISKYKGSELPGWISSPHAHLRALHLSECHHLSALPSFGSLPLLERMIIDQMEGLRVVGREFLGLTTPHSSSSANVISFPKLWLLSIDGCDNWEEWEDITAEEEEASAATSVMPCLESLEITHCKGLATLPHRLLRKVLTLKELDISGSTQLQQHYGDEVGSNWKSISENNPRLKLKNEP